LNEEWAIAELFRADVGYKSNLNPRVTLIICSSFIQLTSLHCTHNILIKPHGSNTLHHFSGLSSNPLTNHLQHLPLLKSHTGKMHLATLFIGLSSFLAATASAVSLPKSLIESSSLTRREEQHSANIVGMVLGDGQHKIAVFEDGEYEGYIIEDKNNGTVSCYDPTGNPIDPDNFDADDDQLGNDEEGGPQRQQRRFLIPLIVRLARLLAPIIARWGRRVWRFVYCVGVSEIWDCGQHIVGCSGAGTPPWDCASAIACLAGKGKDVKKCL
jgi:hypothetical protein